MFLGGMLQFDSTVTKQDGDGRSGEIAGEVWMAGPYVVARDTSSSLIFEGRLLYGLASHDADAVVARAGDAPRDGAFDSERWIAQDRTSLRGDGRGRRPLREIGRPRGRPDRLRGRLLARRERRPGVRRVLIRDRSTGSRELRFGPWSEDGFLARPRSSGVPVARNDLPALGIGTGGGFVRRPGEIAPHPETPSIAWPSRPGRDFRSDARCLPQAIIPRETCLSI